MNKKDISLAKKEILKYKKIYKNIARKFPKGKIPNDHNNDISLKEGIIEWRDKEKNIHRSDGPAIIYKDGEHRYYTHGKRSRNNGPAILNADKSQFWLLNDNEHRKDGPASIYINKKWEVWSYNGKTHRINGFAVIDSINKHIIKNTERKNQHNETYLLCVEGKTYEDPKLYFQACIEWVKKYESAHDAVDIIEKLEKSLREGRFEHNNWENNQFKNPFYLGKNL